MLDSGIYWIENLANGKVYIGSTQFLSRRWEQHTRELRKGRHCNRHLQGAWKEYGETVFFYAILEYCAADDLIVREAWWIELLGATESPRGYNLGAVRSGLISEATRQRMSESQKGRPRPDLIGRKQTPEEKANQIAAQKGKSGLWNKGRKHSEETRAKVAAAGRGRKHSEETKAKMRAARLGKPRSPEAIQKSADGKRGSKHSEEAKMRISAGVQAYLARKKAAEE